MKKLLLFIPFLIFILDGRKDCVGTSCKDKYGVTRTNPNKDLTFTGYAQCLCSCTGEWTQAGKCKMCNHHHKAPNYRKL